MSIRPATLHDLAALADLHARAFARGWGTDSLKGLLDSPGAFALLSEQDDVDGFILIRTALDETEVLTIAVGPDARRRGLGSTLLTQACRHAAGEGAVRMFLEVAATNLPAINLYEKYGFQRIGHRKAYYEDGDDAFVLSAGLPLAMGKAEKTL